MTQTERGIEAITVRRAKLADADKVRYRVYSTATDYIAVIAESALMAVKVSGIKVPHKIMRDLPAEGVAVEAKRMAERETSPEQVPFPLQKPEHTRGNHQTEMAPPPPERATQFVPLGIADLQRKGGVRARILPPEMVSQIIEEHAKAAGTPTPASPSAAPPAATPEPEVLAMPPTPELSQAEKLTSMAEQLLPPTASSHASAPIAEPGGELSPDEVAKLLNE